MKGTEGGWNLGSDVAGALDIDRVDGGVCGCFMEAADDGIDFGEFRHGLRSFRLAGKTFGVSRKYGTLIAG